jgi:hypothetical protein
MKKEQEEQPQASSTTITYVFCLVAAQKALKRSQEVEQGNLYWRMMAGVFAAFTIEGYLNHLGQLLVLDWNDFERKSFAGWKT